MTQRKIKCLTAVFLILTLLVAPAAAHGVYMSWESGSGQITIRVYYQGNEPMANGTVTVETIDASGTASPYLTGKTDANGNYAFAVKEGVSSYLVKAIEGEHAASKRIDIEPAGGGSGSSGGGNNPIFGTDGPSLFTIGAGLGWIVGIAGILLYLQARRMNKGN